MGYDIDCIENKAPLFQEQLLMRVFLPLFHQRYEKRWKAGQKAS